jgi:cytochrome oxidase Cu insertion factor (SCO1/SenC/PrrC family)
MNTTPPPGQMRSRLTLLLIAALFLGSFFVAAALRFTGWQPTGHRNYGELMQPPVDLATHELLRADGTPFAWQPDANRWRLLVAPSAQCSQACGARMMDTLNRIWVGQGQKAARLEVLWFGALPDAPRFRALVPMRADAQLAAQLPEAAQGDSVPVYLVDPSGYLVLHYRPGFDPAGLRKDLGKLIK